MRKREIFFIAVLLLLGVWDYYGHRTVKSEIAIQPSLRPVINRRARGTGTPGVFPVYFTLDHTYKLTSVKVTEVPTNQTTAGAHVLWHLVSSKGSQPVKLFMYGQAIQGMQPDLKGVSTEPLEPNVKYRLDVAAEGTKGDTFFRTHTIPN